MKYTCVRSRGGESKEKPFSCSEFVMDGDDDDGDKLMQEWNINVYLEPKLTILSFSVLQKSTDNVSYPQPTSIANKEEMYMLHTKCLLT